MSFEAVEGQYILTADDDSLVTGAQSHGIDLAAKGLRLRNKRHDWFPPCKNINDFIIVNREKP